ncbi:MAG: alanine--glyoxylate aminotransferase family protein [Proteobacteria bacterium]|nr:alanine--glyoxylate aminotransferase family protein [Pseudomonadota bacterium]
MVSKRYNFTVNHQWAREMVMSNDYGPLSKKRLFTPGPTPLYQDQRQTCHHRSDQFAKISLECAKMLQPLFGSVDLPVMLSSSGTGAMEACLLHLTSPGDQIMVCEAGKFGQRWLAMAEGYHLKSLVCQLPWGRSFSPEIVHSFLSRHSKTKPKVVFIQASETSTGAFHPTKEIAAAIRDYDPEILIVVDAISSLGAHEMKMAEWHIDGVVSGSQKGFGVAPGLSFVALSERGWQHCSNHPKYYFDLVREQKGQKNGQSSWTPAISLIMDLHRVLSAWHKVGLNVIYDYHARGSRATIAALQAMELDLFAQDIPSRSLTSFWVPSSVNGIEFLDHLKKRYGAVFAGGQGALKGKIIRMAHLGYFDDLDLISGIAALQMSLHNLGYHQGECGLQGLMRSLRQDE